MARFLLARLGQACLVLVVVSALIHGLMALMPGDPIDLMLAGNPDMTAEDAERLREIYGLNDPPLERYLKWAGQALQGEFGYSRLYNQPVLDVLLPRLANTLLLLVCALALSVLIAVPLGMIAARRPGGLADQAISLFCFAGISVPSFWLALLLIMFFAVQLGWLPASGMGSEGGLVDGAAHMVLPVLTLTLLSTAIYARHARAAMIQELRADYVRTARAKGVGQPRLLGRHVLRNAMIPLTTVLALDIGTLVGGALITETMFGYLGMGKLIYDAVMANDFNLALIGLLFATGFVLLANFLADIGYAALDPRVTYAGARS